MKIRSVTIALTIVLIPFILGLILFNARSHSVVHGKDNFISDTREENKGIDYKGIKVDWAFCPDWQYKPLFFSSREYLVFVFHYKNNSEEDIELVPSYSFVSSSDKRYSANEEISMYIEDEVENELGVTDETSMSYNISSGATKHYIATFEKPEDLNYFYIDVDIFRDNTLRLHYDKKEGIWINSRNELIEKYKGRG
ncbi:MAG: hypothetical protein P9L96_04790 [Candidatus Gygaella obscura]|nr:hypothetical protein [Candidatus Gygaella obscura]